MQTFLQFTEKWLGGLVELGICFTACALCVLAIGAYWDHRLKLGNLVFWLLYGLCFLSFPIVKACFPAPFPFSPVFVLIAVLLGTIVMVLMIGSSRFGAVDDLEKSSIFASETSCRTVRGTSIAVPVIIMVSGLAVFLVGMAAPQAMIGDEVTHYYMLVGQARDLLHPNFFSDIPTAMGTVETRGYPHPFFWHYGGALLHRLTGDSFIAIQLYQAFFFVQLLTGAYLLARDRNGVESRSALIYVLVLASLPLSLIFSVSFYQDVPLTAQVLSAFYFLNRRRWLPATCFMVLAIGFKVTAVLFFPVFFLCLTVWQVRSTGWYRGLLALIISMVIILSATWGIGRMISVYGHSTFYPQARMEKVLKQGKRYLMSNFPNLSEKLRITEVNTSISARFPQKDKKVSPKPPVIANHPGDLRIKKNYFIYGGLVFWMAILIGLAGTFYCAFNQKIKKGVLGPDRQATGWLYLVGGFYILLAAWLTKTAPDARFFLPGLPFILLPLAEKVTCLPKPKLLITVLATLSFLQGGYILAKTYQLRSVPPEIQEAVSFFQEHPIQGNIFMYPEGNYRLFPVQHEWYLGYHLREFWRADNDHRIRLLHKYNIELLVIKKHLIAEVDLDITDLGVYPVDFVHDIASDPRFVKKFENNKVLIYGVPEK